MGYLNELYVILFFIIGTGILAIIKADSPKIRKKKLSFVIICLGINILAIPMAFFIGGMATAPPDSTELDFWEGFLFIQAIPLLILIIGILKWLIDRGKNK
ncbi:hypothetical protein [Bacillus sp. BP-3]|uniref:hypothetical protein n=1 Tax=Bacillus sp. BP-3 TaxID=3022773 RepID=UPI00232BE688|nr:hypothetical protein [Bacillus sp. BP-3]MDC2866451.1 hypothetical protein [Bacillus sp. BP-3]